MNTEALLKQIESVSSTKAPQSIGILTCVATPGSKQVVSNDLLIPLLRLIRESFSAKITLFEKKFKDTDLSTIDGELQAVINGLSIDIELSTKDSFEKITVPQRVNKVYDNFFLSKNWLASDLKIVVSKGAVHKHHAFLYPWSPLSEVAVYASASDYDWSKLKRKDALQVLRPNFSGIAEDLLTHETFSQILGIVDAREVEVTNEHIPFFKQKKTGAIIFDTDLQCLEDRILALV